MSRIKVNSINPFTGQNITLGGHAIPSGSDKNLGSETNAWSELYISTGSINFVGTNNTTITSIKCGGETGATGPLGMVYIDAQVAAGGGARGSFSVGRQNMASGTASLANGYFNTASGQSSQAQGSSNIASGIASHAEGQGNTSSGLSSHAEGGNNIASGITSHAEGQFNRASDLGAHAEGNYTWASGAFSHTEGFNTTASGFGSHAKGYQTRTDGDAWVSHAEGFLTLASGWGSHAEGSGSITQGRCSHAEGNNTIANGNFQSVTGQFNVANASQSAFIIGDGTANDDRHNILFVSKSHFEVSASKTYLQGLSNTAQTNVLTYNPTTGQVYYTSSVNVTGTTLPVNIQEDGTLIVSNPTFINFTGPGVSASANSTGINVHISGGGSGGGTPAPSDTYIQYNSGSTFGATGSFRFIYTSQSLQQGINTEASGEYSHAEGNKTTTLGDYSHAEGEGSETRGLYSHAEGSSTVAFGTASHTEGRSTRALGDYSHAGGLSTIASGSYQTVFGQYNALTNTSSLFIIGAGSSSAARKDGFSVELDSINNRPHIVLPTNTGNPNNPKTGSMYFNPSTNLMFIYNGTAWRSASFA